MNIYKNKHRGSKLKYIAAEILWYFAGTNSPEFIIKHASLWDKIRNDDGTVNSAYGYLLFNEKKEKLWNQLSQLRLRKRNVKK